MTAQRPIPSGGIAESSVTIPDGLTVEQRSLVNDIMALFKQYELDEFADPNRNTARNRLDRFIKVLHDLSFQSIQGFLDDSSILDTIAINISKNIENEPDKDDGVVQTKEEPEENKKQQPTPVKKQEKINKEKISKEKIKETINSVVSERIEENSKHILEIFNFLNNTEKNQEKNQKPEVKQPSSQQNVNEKKENIDKGTINRPNNIPKQPENKVKIENRQGNAPVKDTAKKSNFVVRKSIAENINSKILKLIKIQNKFTKNNKGKIFSNIIKRNDNQFKFSEIVDKTKNHLENILNSNMVSRASAKISNLNKMAEKSIKKVLGSNIFRKIGKGLGAIGNVATSILGGIFKVLTIGIGLVAGLVILPIKLMVGAIAIASRLISSITKTLIKSVGFVLSVPVKMAKKLLSRKTTFEILTLALATPVGMEFLGIIVGNIINLVKKYGIIGAMWHIVKIGVGLSADMLKGIYEKIGPSIEKGFEAAKEKFKEEWGKFTEAHPAFKKLEEPFRKLKEYIDKSTNWITEKYTTVTSWISNKKEEIKESYNEYVKDALASGVPEDEIMTLNQYLANSLHEMAAEKIDILMESIDATIEAIKPIVQFSVGIVQWLSEHSWLLTVLKIGLNTHTNKISNAIQGVISGILGIPGTILESIISYFVENAILWAYDLLFNKSKGQIFSVDEALKNFDASAPGTPEQRIEYTKKMSEKIGEINVDKFAKIKILDADKNEIDDNEQKKQRVLSLFDEFSSSINNEIAQTNYIIKQLNSLDLVSSSGGSLENENNALDLFKKSNIAGKILKFDYFKVNKIFGIEDKDVLQKMSDLKTTNKQNRMALNLVGLKAFIVGTTYNQILQIIKNKSLTDEDRISLIYEFLGGNLYASIQESLKDNANKDTILEQLSEVTGFDKDKGISEFSKTFGSYITSISEISLAQAQQTNITTRSFENVRNTSNEIRENVSAVSKAISNAEPFGGILPTPPKLLPKNPLDLTNPSMLPQNMAELGAAVTTFIFNRDNAKLETLKKYGGTDSPSENIDLGDVSGASSGIGWFNLLVKYQSMGKLGEISKYLKQKKENEEAIRKGEKPKHVLNSDISNSLYKSFFTDITAIASDFNITAKELQLQLEGIKKLIGEDKTKKLGKQDFINVFTGILSKNTLITDKQREALAEITYKMYNENPDQLDEIPKFLQNISKSLLDIKTDGELVEKYKDKTPAEILEELIRDMTHDNKNMSEFMKDYLKTHYRDANDYFKSAILGKIKLNQDLKEYLDKRNQLLQEKKEKNNSQ